MAEGNVDEVQRFDDYALRQARRRTSRVRALMLDTLAGCSVSIAGSLVLAAPGDFATVLVGTVLIGLAAASARVTRPG